MAQREPRLGEMLLGGYLSWQVCAGVAGCSVCGGCWEALCFGWIDSTLKRLPDGRLVQRLSPRRPKSHWTQLNIDRCMALEARGLMTEAGRCALLKGK